MSSAQSTYSDLQWPCLRRWWGLLATEHLDPSQSPCRMQSKRSKMSSFALHPWGWWEMPFCSLSSGKWTSTCFTTRPVRIVRTVRIVRMMYQSHLERPHLERFVEMLCVDLFEIWCLVLIAHCMSLLVIAWHYWLHHIQLHIVATRFQAHKTATVLPGLCVVNINYRLGILGFLAHPELSEEQNGSGNYAILDQIAALQWVGDNIRAFGGDPKNVTLWGLSSGAQYVSTLLVSPAAEGLFHKAMVQSCADLNNVRQACGSCDVWLGKTAEEWGHQLCQDFRHVPMLRLSAWRMLVIPNNYGRNLRETLEKCNKASRPRQ